MRSSAQQEGSSHEPWHSVETRRPSARAPRPNRMARPKAALGSRLARNRRCLGRGKHFTLSGIRSMGTTSLIAGSKSSIAICASVRSARSYRVGQESK
jgi:hypothetical protein